MKTKGFKWLLGLLTEASASIRILDTYIMRNFVATDCYFSDGEGIRHKKLGFDKGSKEILEMIAGNKSVLGVNKTMLAIGYYRGGRIYFTEATLQEFYCNPHYNFTYIQKCGAQCMQSCQFFTATLVFKSESYDFKFYLILENAKKRVKNIIWIQRVKDMLASVNFIVQERARCKVVKAKYELVKDSDDFFWVSFYSCEIFHETKSEAREKKLYFKVETPELTDESDEEASKESLSKQVSMKKVTIGKQNEPFSSDFLELICRNRIKERKSPDLKLPSRLFYAEPEEVNAEKVKIMRLMQDRNLMTKGLKNEKMPRRTIWMDQSPRKSHFVSPLPRISSPMLLSPDNQRLLLNLTPSPMPNQKFLQLPGVGIRKSLKKVTLKRDSRVLS